MVEEISQQLKEKLKLIEIETDFFSHTPKKPRQSQFLFWAMGIILLASAYITLSGGNTSLFLLNLLITGIYLFNYLHQKRVYDMYSSACEIINYYRKGDDTKI